MLPVDIYLELCSYLDPSSLARLCCVDHSGKRVVEAYIHRQVIGEELPSRGVTLYYYFWKLRQLEPMEVDDCKDEWYIVIENYLLLASFFPSNLHSWWNHLKQLTGIYIEELLIIYLAHFGDQVELLDWIIQSFEEGEVIILELYSRHILPFQRTVEYLMLEYPSEAMVFQNLRTIDLNNTNLKEVPPLTYFQRLDVLNLGNNQLTTIPQWCWKLKHLVLDCNPLEFADYSIDTIVSMRELSMKDCGLTQLDWLFQPALSFNVTKVNLSRNRLTKALLNKNFKADYLWLQKNRLTCFAGELVCSSLNLAFNDLEYARVRSSIKLELNNNPRLHCWSIEDVREVQLQYIGQRKITLQEITDRSTLRRVTIDNEQIFLTAEQVKVTVASGI